MATANSNALLQRCIIPGFPYSIASSIGGRKLAGNEKTCRERKRPAKDSTIVRLRASVSRLAQLLHMRFANVYFGSARAGMM